MPTKPTNPNLFILQGRHSSVSQPWCICGILQSYLRVGRLSLFRVKGRWPPVREIDLKHGDSRLRQIFGGPRSACDGSDYSRARLARPEVCAKAGRGVFSFVGGHIASFDGMRLLGLSVKHGDGAPWLQQQSAVAIANCSRPALLARPNLYVNAGRAL